LEQYEIRVADPISLLYAKVHLTLKVSQKGRRDADHLAIMVLCVRAFLRMALPRAERGEMPVRGWLAAAERVLTLSESSAGKKVSRRIAIDWYEALPLKEIENSRNPRIISFRDKRLSRWRARIALFSRGYSED